MLTMSVEIENELIKLENCKKELLLNFYKFNDFKDDEIRINILNLINLFNESLIFIKTELEFEYDLNLSSLIGNQHHDNQIVLSYIIEFDKEQDFLNNFKQNFIKKQFDIKKSYYKNYEKFKYERYNLDKSNEEKANPQNESQDFLPISTNSKIMNTSKKITSKLSSSSQILQSSLIQSQLNMEELTIQNDSLIYLSNRYEYLNVILEKSDGFINDLKLSSLKDKQRMYYSLIFFGICVLWVFWRRIFKLPTLLIWRIFWYFIKLSLISIGLISPRKNDVGAKFEFNGIDAMKESIKEYGTVATTTSTKPFETSKFKDDVIEGNENDVIEGNENDDDDEYEGLSKIIDEL